MTNIKKVYNEMIDRGFNYILDKMEPLSDNITEQEGSLSVNIKDLGEYLFNRQPALLDLIYRVINGYKKKRIFLYKNF
ncbi:hypothetical protein G9O61_00g014300 [Vairimorpha ceranae]|nr:hypothetical protein G9O61_00g014300 [Vairimorpha ceranae]